MKRIVKWVAILVGLLILALASLPFLIDANRFRPTLESSLTDALHRQVKLGKLSLSIFSGSVEANDLEIAEDAAFGKAPFLRAKSIKVGVELRPFILSHKLNVTGITIEKPEITLTQKPNGTWNYSSLGTDASTPGKAKTKTTTSTSETAGGMAALTVHQLNISDGSLTIGRTTDNWKPLVLEALNLEVKEFSPTSSFPFSLSSKVKGGGAIKLDGKAGPLNPTDASMMPATIKLSLTALDLAATGLANYAPDLGGIISLDGNGDTDGTTMKVNGTIKAEKLKLAKTGTPAKIPVQFNFALENDLRKHSGQLKKGDVQIGKAPASITGRYYEQGNDMMLKMNLDAPNMAVSEIVSMLGPLGIVLPSGSSLQDGTIATKFSLEGPVDKLVTNGTLAVRGTKLVGFDLGKNMSLVTEMAGIHTGSSTEIQNASANVNVSPAGIQANAIQLNVPAVGDLRGDGTISPTNALDFKMSAALHTSGNAALIANRQIPFFVQGTSSQPVFKPDLKGLAKEQLNAIKDDPVSTTNSLIKGLFGGKK